MNAVLWMPRGPTGPVLRGNILRILSCNGCNWPLMNPCPMCVQNPIPEVLDLANLCPIMISDDGMNFHRHCLKWSLLMSAVRTQDGVTIGYVPGGIVFPMPYTTVAPPVNPIVLQGSLPQGLLQQRPVHQGLVGPGHVQQELVPQGFVQPAIGVLISQVPSGVMLQFAAQSPLVGAPLMAMSVAGPSPQPQADSTQENSAAMPQCSYGSLCDCSDFEQD